MIERIFLLRERGTTARTEVVAGLTTFLTMSYIIFVQPISHYHLNIGDYYANEEGRRSRFVKIQHPSLAAGSSQEIGLGYVHAFAGSPAGLCRMQD